MEKEKKVAIEKIVLNIDGEKVSLTPEQAKKLKSLLDEMFGKEVIKEIHHHDSYRPYWIWNYSSQPYLYCQSTGVSNLTNNVNSSVLYSDATLEIKL